jgi:type I restriction enzyme S subunit
MIKELTMEKANLPVGWLSKKLDALCDVEYGTRVVRKRDGGTIHPVYGGGGATFFMDTFNREDCLVVARFAMSEKCTRFVRGKFFLNDSGLSVKPKDIDIISQEFLNKYFIYLNDYIYSLARGAAQKNLNVPAFRKLEILYPKSIPQQKQIVAILDKAFAAIDTAKANAEQNLQNAKELFESYLQNVFENKGDDWAEYELSEIVDKRCSLSYGIVQPGDEFPNGLPVIRPTNMKNKFVYPLGLKLIDPTKAESYKRTSLVGDELLLCVRGETGVTSLITDELKGANVTRGIVPVCFDSEKLSLPFGYYLFVSPFVQKQIKDKTYGAALMQINIRDVRKLLVRIPSKKEQEKIVKKLDSLSEEIEKIEAIYTQKIADLEEMKKSVLQKAFFGQLNTIN